MASGRAADRDNPGKPRRTAARSVDGDPIRELHQGQRSEAPHQRAGHMTAPDHIAKAETNAFARGGRPHMVFADWSRWAGRGLCRELGPAPPTGGDTETIHDQGTEQAIS